MHSAPAPQDTSPRAIVRELWRLGLPIVVAMGASIGLGVTDTLVVGLSGSEALAALAVGANLSFVLVMGLIGLQSVLPARVAAHHVRGRDAALVEDTWQSWWLGLGIGTLMMIGLWIAAPQLTRLGLDPAVEAEAHRYLLIVSPTLVLMGTLLALRQTLNGLGLTALNMRISLFAFAANAVLDGLLVLGPGPLPALGATGAAIATVCVVLLQSGHAAWLIHTHPVTAPYRFWQGFQGPRLPALARLAAIGLPAGIALALEEGFFAATTVLAAPMGTVPLAAHQLILSTALACLVVPLGLAQAAVIMIGRAIGGEQGVLARRIAWTTVAHSAALAGVLGLALWSVRAHWGDWLSPDPAVAAMTAALMAVLAVQLVADSTQITAGIALRGWQDTRVPAAIQSIGYWAVGVPLAWWLSRHPPAGVAPLTALWIAICVALSLTAIAALWRLAVVSRRPLDDR